MTGAPPQPAGHGRGPTPRADLDRAVEKGRALTVAALASERVDRPAAEFGEAVRSAVAIGATLEEVAEVTGVSETTIERIADKAR
ncbi:hypothetical protein BH10ACT1_BH10ACT1_18080 [soil metagenome]